MNPLWLRGGSPPDRIERLQSREITDGPRGLQRGRIVKIIDPVCEMLKISLKPMIRKRLDG